MRPAEDLFGSTDHPRKGGPDYLPWLRSLPGLPGKFLKRSTERLAPDVPEEHVDVIICTDADGRWTQLVLDLRTGERYVGEPNG